MKSDFTVAVHALVYLYHKKTRQSSAQLAQNVCTNPARIRRVMAKMRAAGMVETREGAEGGYAATQTLGQTTLAEILRACGERLIEPNWRSGDAEADCKVASGMAEQMDRIFDTLNETCAQQLRLTSVAQIERNLTEERENV